MQPTAASSACSDKRAHLAHRLKEALPLGARLALCFDPEGDLDGYDSIGADASRLWQILTYREDDLSFRLAVHELEAKGWNAGSPVLLRVAMPEMVPLGHRIELSFLGDLLSRVEGDPIDLRTDAAVTFHTEPVTWPDNLQKYAGRIGRDLKGFVEGYWRMRRAIGRDRPLGRHHVAAALLWRNHGSSTINTWRCPTRILPKSSPDSSPWRPSTDSMRRMSACSGTCSRPRGISLRIPRTRPGWNFLPGKASSYWCSRTSSKARACSTHPFPSLAWGSSPDRCMS